MTLSSEERTRHIEQYASAPGRLRETLAGVPAEAMKWRPEAGEFSVHEIVCHCADSETNAYSRIRYLLTEEKPVIVGVNKFVQEDEEPQMIFRVNPEAERGQIESLARVRKERDQAAVDAALSRLEEVSRDGENLMYPITEAVKNYASIGEICGVMRRVFGDYQPPTAV